MRTLIVCVSVSHGNTRQVAGAIADVLDADVVEPEEVDPASLADYDLVGFGSGVFAMAMHPRLRDFVARLPGVRSGRAFVFSANGLGRLQSRPFSRPLSRLLEDRGYEIVGTFACKGFDTWLPLRLVGGLNKGRPNAQDLDRARAFAAELRAKVEAG